MREVPPEWWYWRFSAGYGDKRHETVLNKEEENSAGWSRWRRCGSALRTGTGDRARTVLRLPHAGMLSINDDIKALPPVSSELPFWSG